MSSIPISDIVMWGFGVLGAVIAGVVIYRLTQGNAALEKRIEELATQQAKVQSDVAVLKEVKIDESKARQIVAESIEPIKHGQEEIRTDIKEMITTISNLSVQLARAGLMRGRDVQD